MLYEKNKNETLSDNLFRDPTAEYRGAPFWAWNDALEEEECVRQAHIFREMGFGGYHIHPRAGLATPYLGEKFLSCVKACAEDAKKSDMLCWLYDEDRYPSGFAGGFVTKDGRFRRRGLIFTTKKRVEDAAFSDGRQCSGTRLLATYALRRRFGKLISYKRLKEGEKGGGKLFYAYLVVDEPTDGFNQAGYVDALCKEALDAFAEITYGAYEKCVGGEFGKTIPAMFTDEPQMKFVRPLPSALCPTEATIPWTDDFAETYEKAFGEDLLDSLPELFFDSDLDSAFRTRWQYHTHRTERFAEAFSDNLGIRLSSLGLSLTGHLMEEPMLSTQFAAVGETMRHYKHFGIPGIDMLCGRHEYTTALQTRSVVRQEGKEGMLCELYGVSRWAVEFGKFKEEGDWLACLGVTVRVPHLSYYSMRGEAKRDYPPSIFYQAPWYLKFKAVEDHFARLNAALTRGKAINEVAVIHPIESYYLLPMNKHAARQYGKVYDYAFRRLTEWLLFGGVDFDYLSEALLPLQRGDDPLAVGECRYKTILVPDLMTIRRTTLDYLRAFRAAGGKVVFLGEVPMLVDGVESSDAIDLARECVLVPYEEEAVADAVRENVSVTVTSDRRKGEYLATLREDGEGEWLFLTAPRAGYPYPRSVALKNDPVVIEDEVTVGVKGEWSVTEYDTATGEIRPLDVTHENGFSYVHKTLYNNDSLLLRLDGEAAVAPVVRTSDDAEDDTSRLPKEVETEKRVRYTADEPNVLLLDYAQWSVGDGFRKRAPLDRVTKLAREAFGLGKYRHDLQPWMRTPSGARHDLALRFEFDSDVAVPAHFACEYDAFSLSVNGRVIAAESDGWYVDKAFRTFPVEIGKGHNVIDLVIPIGEYDCCENCYLLGSFAVELVGTGARLTAMPERLEFRDVTEQGFPFYGGKITYHTSFEAKGERAEIGARYASALLTVRVNGEEKDILYSPYRATFPTKSGENTLDLVAYIPRQNAFGPVHIRKKYKLSDSPKWFRKASLPWRVRRYVLDEGGILEPPKVLLK